MITSKANTLVVTGVGDQDIAGPIDICTIVVSAGSVSIKKGSDIIVTLASGAHNIRIRSASGLTVNGACTLVLSVVNN